MDSLIGAISQNEMEELRIHLKKSKGREVVDIRVWASLKAGGEKIPTGKGVSIDRRQWEEFKNMLREPESRPEKIRQVHE
jgi:hypothetical protein